MLDAIIRLLLAGLWAFGAAGFFAFVFNSSKYDIGWAALLGAIGWVLYLTIARFSNSEVVGYLAGAFAVGLLAEVIAWFVHNPATVYVVPGLLPLVPGGGMYQTMRAAVSGDMANLGSTGFKTLSAAAAIAVGIAIASSVARITSLLVRRWRQRRDSIRKAPVRRGE